METVDLYRRILRNDQERIGEGGLFASLKKLSEIEIQSRWFSGEFGRKFIAIDGREIEVVQFGVWNREAGPDFSEAAISIDGGKPERGCIELDLDVRDWERHGHVSNPAYETVVLHVFVQHRESPAYFTHTVGNRYVPQIRIEVNELAESAPVAFAKPGRCQFVLGELPDEKIESVLCGAAQYRMKLKAARFARLSELHGEDEALYQSLAVTLGYKANKLPFTLIAQRMPLRILLQNKTDSDSILFGIGGFLNQPNLSSFEPETQGLLRRLWDRWWTRRSLFERLVIRSTEWQMSGQRPVNHPQRRLAALSEVVRQWSKVRALSHQCQVHEIHEFFDQIRDEYWDHHYTLISGRSVRRMALIGKTRVEEMLANVFFPKAILYDPSRWKDFEKLPASLYNRRARIAALRLFGAESGGARFLKSSASQQGLLQIYDDFCAMDCSDCLACRFPEQVKKMTNS